VPSPPNFVCTNRITKETNNKISERSIIKKKRRPLEEMQVGIYAHVLAWCILYHPK